MVCVVAMLVVAKTNLHFLFIFLNCLFAWVFFGGFDTTLLGVVLCLAAAAVVCIQAETCAAIFVPNINKDRRQTD